MPLLIAVGTGCLGAVRSVQAQELLPPEQALEKYRDILFAPAEDLKWFEDAHFGVFMHWGPCSIAEAEISWGRNGPRGPGSHATGGVPEAEYNALYKQFDPVRFDADEWVGMVKDAGAKYLIFTTKHHDGFCMFDAKNTDWKITNTPFGRDVCKELADACHRQGIKLFWYYSQPDWTHPDYKTQNHERYRAYMYEHLRQLLTDYGKIDGVWFDCLGTSWKDWNTPEMVKMMRELQPGLLINSRWGWGLPGVKYNGDFQNPEQSIGNFMVDVPWETCATITGGWSWTGGHNPKTPRTCTRMLIECAGSGGNLALNTGPKPDGTISEDAKRVYHQMGEWLRKYGESIYGTRGGPFKPALWGVSTHKGKTIYLHVLTQTTTDKIAIYLPPIAAKVVSARAADGVKTAFRQDEKGIHLVLRGKNLNEFLDNVVALRLDRDAAGIAPVDTAPYRHARRIAEIHSSSNYSPDMAPEKLLVNGGKGEFKAGIVHKPFWMPSPSDKQPWLEIGFGREKRVNALKVEEHIGVCAVRAFELEYRQDGKWKPLYASDEIGLDFSLQFPPVKTTGIRLRITKCAAGETPRISLLKAYFVSDKQPPAQVLLAEDADTRGAVKLEQDGYLGYWLDGSEVSWLVRTEKPKTCEVALETACPGDQGGEAVVLVNGKEAFSFQVPLSKGWNNYVTTTAGTIELPAGENRISIKGKKLNGFALMNLKKVVLTEDFD